jgi:HNH endonuclease
MDFGGCRPPRLEPGVRSSFRLFVISGEVRDNFYIFPYTSLSISYIKIAMRHSAEIMGERVMRRSAVNVETALVNGVHCREWRGARHNQGYGRLWDGERLQYTHRLSYAAFVGAIPEGLDVLHRCDNPRCIEPLHLKCGTHQENMADQYSRGRHLPGRAVAAAKRRGQGAPWARGSRHPRSKLDEDDVRTIWRRLKKPRVGRQDTQSALAREFGVSDSLIKAIRNGKGWGWLTRMM